MHASCWTEAYSYTITWFCISAWHCGCHSTLMLNSVSQHYLELYCKRKTLTHVEVLRAKRSSTYRHLTNNAWVALSQPLICGQEYPDCDAEHQLHDAAAPACWLLFFWVHGQNFYSGKSNKRRQDNPVLPLQRKALTTGRSGPGTFQPWNLRQRSFLASRAQIGMIQEF